MSKRFIAHVILRPHDGQPQYTVETEFKAVSYPQAWEHVSRLGARFNATIVSHRIIEKEGDASEGETALFLPAPSAVDAAVGLPAPTLTVNVEPLAWAKSVTIKMPEVKPFPIEEVKDDTAAA